MKNDQFLSSIVQILVNDVHVSKDQTKKVETHILQL